MWCFVWWFWAAKNMPTFSSLFLGCPESGIGGWEEDIHDRSIRCPPSQNLCFHKHAPTPTSTTLVVSVYPEVGCPLSVTRHMITQRRPKPPKKETLQWSTILFLHWYFSL